MHQIRQAILSMISASDQEMNQLLHGCFLKTFQRQEISSHSGVTPNDIFFINKGILRVIVHDNQDVET